MTTTLRLTLKSGDSAAIPAASVAGVLLAVTLLTMGFFGGFAHAESADAKGSDGNAAAVKPQASSGMQVHIDPETGELVQEAPAGSAQPQLRASQDLPELVEEPSPVAGGGTMIRLDSRFQAEFKANVDSDGKMNTECTDADHTGHNH